MITIIRLSCLVLLLHVSGPAIWAQSVSLPPTDRGFADWLFAQQEYVRAAGEYYRVLFRTPPEKRDALLYRIGGCFQKAGEYRQALLAFEKIIAEYPHSSYTENAYYESAYCSYKLGEFQALDGQIRRLNLSGPLPPRFLLLAGVGLLSSGDWINGQAQLERYLAASDRPPAHEITLLISIAREAAVPETRSGLTAGILSAFFPGSGKFYAGRPEDGFISLLFCGFCGGMAAYHFINEGNTSAAAWVFTALGGIFYIANIYGSVIAAEQYGQIRQRNFQQRIQNLVTIILP
jgi:tetratricopeptide (TPR) repeat protein